MTAASHTLDLPEESVAIRGVGLIGGSIAAALKARGFTGTVIGSGRDASRLAAARSAGLLDEITTEPPRASLVVVCTPVDRIAGDVREAAHVAAQGTLITDAGSVKGSICDELAAGLPQGVAFVGAHPLAGSERRGFEHADADLFVDAPCVVVAGEGRAAESVHRAERFWRFLGARTMRLTAEEHDRTIARTSHLPHVVAAALVASLDEGDRRFAASGFRDTTRIASGDAELWTAILLQNAPAILDAIGRLHERLEEFRDVIAARDANTLRDLLARSQATRDSLPVPQRE